MKKINVPTKRNALLQKTLDRINENEEIQTLWYVINTNAIDRLGMSDHGPVHFQIVANTALRILRILKKHKIQTSIEKDFELGYEHAEVVVLLASVLHDIGMAANRDGHEEFSLFMTYTLLRELLAFIPTQERTIVISETMHAIINHRSGGRPITLEGGIVRVADALDMSKGRTRVPYEAGRIDIYSISAFAIDRVEIHEGDEKPVEIAIYMENSAGIFQVDQLLKEKMANSGIQQYLEVEAHIETETEKKLITDFKL